MPKAPMISRRASWLPGVVLCLACAPGDVPIPSATEFPLAYYHDDCAPWDGHALSFVLTHAEMASAFEALYPHVRVTSYRPPAQLAGASLEWSGVAMDLGHASWCPSAEGCRSAASVRLRLDRDQPVQNELSGQLHVEFEGGHVVSGAFRAVHLQTEMLCG